MQGTTIAVTIVGLLRCRRRTGREATPLGFRPVVPQFLRLLEITGADILFPITDT
ncbi:hypothetical protein ACFXA3_25260 [Streptomyces sp. NPDC059456]|uniref:hypothetical protein n=1 Tax=Streptomyces sp. NPDC059456 TaxID=3346838 RepID=UPI0036738B70